MWLQSVLGFLYFLIDTLPSLLWRWGVAWLLTLIVLIYSFHWIKPHIRPHAFRVDDRVRAWARGFRFKGHVDSPRERIALTWFFRFWTNLASAPSLSLLSLIVPFGLYWHQLGAFLNVTQTGTATHLQSVRVWLLPGLCYFGSMFMSYVTKRVFKRLRPPIEKGAFGHKLTRDPSFPSGHSLTSFCFWIPMAIALALAGGSVGAVVSMALVAVTIVALTGLSRIYMAVHYPSDVVGGYTIGLVWCLTCYLALRGAL
ncbi:MAG: phosphatase PAP2 family protein [Abitibacteriaceae bacterium]|nr:phosphatase PAP2 family protein [Abditibacteriaceae bacterium]MBV9863845.1 phosphatase PAP2 family protein [Abditibacteriaceae bacterium]